MAQLTFIPRFFAYLAHSVIIRCKQCVLCHLMDSRAAEHRHYILLSIFCLLLALFFTICYN